MRLGENKRKIVPIVAPVAKGRPAASAQHQPGIAQAEFMAVLDMDALATGQAMCRAVDGELHVFLRLEIDFHPRIIIIPNSNMAEFPNRNITVQFAIDPVEQIERKLSGDTGAVVIGIDQHMLILDPVQSDQQLRTDAQRFAHEPEQVD